MHDEHDKHLHEYRGRIRRIRRLLRVLPRRASIGRYPVLKWFAGAARKSWFLWSFKRGPLMRAIYFGSVLSLLPLLGVQLPLAVLLCLSVRANLPVCAALQFITNPFTAVPIYGATYLVGHRILYTLSASDVPYEPGVALELIARGDLTSAAGDVVGGLIVGGIVAGLALGVVVDLIWRFAAWEAAQFKARFAALRAARAAARAAQQKA